jgi:bifunctional enzyme CysN/CysC
MEQQEKTLLRLVTTGSVDDGKSTLIGRLLYETHGIFEDQYAAIERTSRKKGLEDVDLALLLDGLSAEREQGITIDVAYRYFESPKRKFIIADSPGHEQYTRNMVTGASNAELAIILIDARRGVLPQSKRHGLIVSLLQVPHLIVAINKMDLVDYSETVYNDIVAMYEAFSDKLEIHDITFIPVSALKGDNVVRKSDRMPWYDGFTLLHYLENVHVSADRNLVDFRFPVQYVIRPHQDFRGFAGSILSGTIHKGQEIAVLPSGNTSTVASIVTYDKGEQPEAFVGQAVTLTLADELDVSRGDMIVRQNNLPQVGQHIGAILCWMDDSRALEQGKFYLLKQTTRTVRAYITRIIYKIDVNTLHREQTEKLELNEIGRLEIRTALPIFFDSYNANRGTGSFILIDPLTQNTVGAGLIRGAVQTISDITEQPAAEPQLRRKSPHAVWSGWNIPRAERETRNQHQAAVLWLTGLSGSGKSTIAKRLERELFAAGCQTMLLDGDLIRHGLNGDLGFTPAERSENIRRVGEVAKLFFESGHLVLCTFISPFAKDRAFVRSLLPADRFWEIYVKCDLEVCKRRDPNGLYQKALSGEIAEFTGISSPYEAPDRPELIVETDLVSVEDIVAHIIDALRHEQIILHPSSTL